MVLFFYILEIPTYQYECYMFTLHLHVHTCVHTVRLGHMITVKGRKGILNNSKKNVSNIFNSSSNHYLVLNRIGWTY